MSNTPRTDKVATYEGNWDTKALRMTNFARRLETELAQAKELASNLITENARLKNELDSVKAGQANAIELTEAEWAEVNFYFTRWKTCHSVDKLITQALKLRERSKNGNTK